MNGSRVMGLWSVAPLVLMMAGRAAAQQAAAPGRVAVFLDCQTFCDFNFVRREITFVDWVRDRNDADVHLLLTSQETGGGGREFTLAFIGLRQFVGSADTLRVVTRNTDVDDDIRQAQVRVMKLGLVRFAARSTVAEHLHVAYDGQDTSKAATTADPWNAWVFQLNAGGFGNGEQSSSFLSLNGSVRANRVTEALKVQVNVNGRSQRSTFQLTDTTTESLSHNYGLSGLIVWSLGPQWSAGLRSDATSSTRVNQRISVSGGPAIEFDFYPYAQSTRQQVTLQYSITPVFIGYEDTTIFNRIDETRIRQRLALGAGITQPWGSINGSLEGNTFMDDWSQHSINVFGEANVRIFRGLSINIFGEFTRLKDQIYLPKAGASDQDILLQQRQLGTDYQYFVSFGFNYQFGSKLNNVVNPRFNGGN